MNSQVQTIEFPRDGDHCIIPKNSEWMRFHSITYAEGLMLFREFSISSNDDNADKMFVGITSPDHMVLFPENKDPSKKYFPVGPFRCAYGSIEHIFNDEFQSFNFDFWVKNTHYEPIEIELCAVIKFMKRTK